MNYYNDNDSFSVKWLKALIAEGLIPKGDVDDRSITEIKPSELDGYTQCHFFAGIGGWPYALRLSGWPEDRPVWTGSCPCQPFSVAGQGKGIKDERHLWPAFRWLIAQKRPATIFGEQVASSDGREWLSGVRLDLETMGYEVGAADLCAAGVWGPRRISGKGHVCGTTITGWVSPTAQDHSRGVKPPREHDTGIPLSQQVSGLIPSPSPAPMESGEGCLAGWSTPHNGGDGGNPEISKGKNDTAGRQKAGKVTGGLTTRNRTPCTDR
jgi:hypothetical protein